MSYGGTAIAEEHMTPESSKRAESEGGSNASLVGGAPSSRTSHTEISSTVAGQERPKEPPSTIVVGEKFGRYEILRHLGSGGMGDVFLAKDGQLERLVALKVPRIRHDDLDEISRFYREARLAARLDRHPNLCPTLDVGECDGRPYLTMSFIDGRCLTSLVSSSPHEPETKLASIIRQIAAGMVEAHRQGVLHRDLKPSNVVLGRDGAPVVMDFGLARDVLPGKVEPTLTIPGHLVGTLAYMSPEQMRGDPDLTPATDIYSLGVILYELLTGRRPFLGTPTEVIGQVLTSTPPAPRQLRPDISPGLEGICLKAIAKLPADRYRSMEELAQALDEFQRAVPQPAPAARIRVPAFHYGGVVPPEFFIGRAAELQRAEQAVRSQSNLLLVGELRSGKTSFGKMLIHRIMGRPGNDTLGVYLNVQQWPTLTIATFLEHTIISLVGEISRQVFGVKFTALGSDDPSRGRPDLQADSGFEAFLDVYRFIRSRTHRGDSSTSDPFRTEEFIHAHSELMNVLRIRKWGNCFVFYDEANRLPRDLSMDLLLSHQEALAGAGLTSIYSASPVTVSQHQALQDWFVDQIDLGPFVDHSEMRSLLARYYFGAGDQPPDVPVSTAAFERLWQYSRGMPFLIQLLAGRSFEMASRSGDSELTEQHVDSAYVALSRERESIFKASAP